MTHFRGPRRLKLEFGITLIVLVSAVVFSLETKDFVVDNTLERHYSDLVRFQKAVNTVNQKAPSAGELNQVITNLLELENGNFILKDDAKLFRAKTYEKLNQTSNSLDLLNEIIRQGDDRLSQADAVIELALYYDKQGNRKEAISVLEKNQKHFRGYREREMYFHLARLAYAENNISLAGRYLTRVPWVDSEYEYLYAQIAEQNWANFDRSEKETILDRLYDMKIFETYARLTGKFIEQYAPASEQVESLVLNVIARTRGDYVKNLIEKLKTNSAYTNIYHDMLEVYSQTGGEMSTGSARARGVYYYTRLNVYRKLNNYSSASVNKEYENYLKGNIDAEYAGMNLVPVIRNMLAYKDYAGITNLVEKTYEKLNVNREIGVIDQAVSFWNGYCHFVLGDNQGALPELENAIAYKVDDYYAINARQLIMQILKMQEKSLEEYLSTLEYKYISRPDVFSKLHYAKILYSFRRGYGKEMLREKIVEMTKQVYGPNSLYDFDQDVVKQLKVSKDYVRYVAYARFGFVEKAMALLTTAGVEDMRTKEMLLLKELIKSKQFFQARDMLYRLRQNKFLDRHYAFFPRDLKMLYYPRPYDTEIKTAMTKLKDCRVDECLIYSVIRGESMYMPNARSRVGARGLMQLMPSTGRFIAQRIFGTGEVDFYNPANNIIMGSVYLNDNIRAYGLYIAVASYNGGNGIVRKTTRKFNPANELELMEIIPYKETRDYIKKIITNYYRYMELYQKAELTVDLGHIIPLKV